MSKNAQLFINHTWICLLLLTSCIELRKSIGAPATKVRQKLSIVAKDENSTEHFVHLDQ